MKEYVSKPPLHFQSLIIAITSCFIQGKTGSVITSHAFTFVGYQNCVPTSEKQPNNWWQVNTIAGHAMQGMCYIP
jgi:hypothetical protein